MKDRKSENRNFWPISTIKQIPKEKLSSSERLVLLLLLDWQEGCEIRISAATLSEQSGLHEQTVCRLLRGLVEKGLLEMKQKRRGLKCVYVKKVNKTALAKLAAGKVDEDEPMLERCDLENDEAHQKYLADLIIAEMDRVSTSAG